MKKAYSFFYFVALFELKNSYHKHFIAGVTKMTNELSPLLPKQCSLVPKLKAACGNPWQYKATHGVAVCWRTYFLQNINPQPNYKYAPA